MDAAAALELMEHQVASRIVSVVSARGPCGFMKVVRDRTYMAKYYYNGKTLFCEVDYVPLEENIRKYGALGLKMWRSSLVHEALHTVHTSPKAIYLAQGEVEPEQELEDVFNVVEDYYIDTYAAAAWPGFKREIDETNDYVMSRMRAAMESRRLRGESANVVTAQFLLCLYGYAPSNVLPRVARACEYVRRNLRADTPLKGRVEIAKRALKILGEFAMVGGHPPAVALQMLLNVSVAAKEGEVEGVTSDEERELVEGVKAKIKSGSRAGDPLLRYDPVRIEVPREAEARLVSLLRRVRAGASEVLSRVGFEYDPEAHIAGAPPMIDERSVRYEDRVALVLDMSGSMKLDEKDTMAAVSLIGRALAAFGRVRLAVYVFRGCVVGADVRGCVHEIKPLNRPWGKDVEDRLSRATAFGDTPLGRVLLHLYPKLAQVRRVIVVTDGQPDDPLLVSRAVAALKSRGVRVVGVYIGRESDLAWKRLKELGFDLVASVSGVDELPDELVRSMFGF